MPGIPLVGGSSTVAGVSLLTLREQLARQIGAFVRGTVTTVASGLEAERYVISSVLRGDRHGPAAWDDHYLYVTSAGDEQYTQRAAQPGTFEGPQGALYLDEPFASGPLAESTTFEISRLPAADYQGVSGLNRAINDGLHLLPVVDWIDQTLAAGQLNYPLTGLAWPIKSVRSVAFARTSTTSEPRIALARGSWEFQPDAEVPQLAFLSLPGNAGDVIELEVVRPADTWIKSNGAWGDSATGLVADDDCCLYDPNTVVAQALPFALGYLAQTYARGSKERDGLEAEAAKARTAGALSRWFGGRRGNGAQRVGATGGRRNWSKGWRP